MQCAGKRPTKIRSEIDGKTGDCLTDGEYTNEGQPPPVRSSAPRTSEKRDQSIGISARLLIVHVLDIDMQLSWMVVYDQ